jgi:hypothetical protein
MGNGLRGVTNSSFLGQSDQDREPPGKRGNLKAVPLVDGLQADGWSLVPIGALFNGRSQVRCAWFELR